MTLAYLPVRFHLVFASPVYAGVNPLFVLRSVLGKQLHSMSCIATQSKCQDCMYSKSCAYSFLFETILSQQNEVLPGRDKGSHPFAFTDGFFCTENTITEYDFTITLFGKAIDYLPYIYAAFVRAGQNGLFKSRIQFEITQVSVDGKKIQIDSKHIDTSSPPKIWSFNSLNEMRKGEILVELKTPLRFKYGGKYGTDFSAQDFFKCLFRRAKTLSTLYGGCDDLPDYNPAEELEISRRNLDWQDFRHYSARQKEVMNLGGSLGTFKLCGTFSAMEQNLLEFSRICNAGKNTNFGLGQIDFWAK